MSLHKIAVISDTHGLLRPEVVKELRDCELILHGGDINSQVIPDKLNQIAKVIVVRGNNDKEWAKNIPEEMSIKLYGRQVYMILKSKFLKKHEMPM